MRAVLGLIICAVPAASGVHAQEALSYGFEGRVGLGYLSQTTADTLDDGFQYKGLVLRAEGIGQIEFEPMDALRLGALARVSWQMGAGSHYDLLDEGNISSGGGSKFGGADLDLALYAALPMVTLSYGEMESAFDFATLEIGQGGSILDGGNAVWMNIGDATGSAGDRGAAIASPGPVAGIDHRSLRADVTLGDFTLSASESKGELGAAATNGTAEAAGLIWKHDFSGTEVFLGAGYDRGPNDKFRSVSLGVTARGLNLVLNRIHRTPLVINNSDTAAFDITYCGRSLSYDFGALTLGIAQGRQEAMPFAPTLFEGKARAIWASWEARENVSVDAEFSENTYPGGGDETRKASIAVSMDF